MWDTLSTLSGSLSARSGEASAESPRLVGGCCQPVSGDTGIVRGKLNAVGRVAQLPGSEKSSARPGKGVQKAGIRRKNAHEMGHKIDGLACEVHLVPWAEVFPPDASRKDARAVLLFANAPACSNQDELRLVAEHTLMRAASLRLVPRDEGTPSPACHLQGITGCRQLRQSVKHMNQPLWRVSLKASCIHMTDQRKWERWSRVSDSKERYLADEMYLRAGEVLRSAVVNPPEA